MDTRRARIATRILAWAPLAIAPLCWAPSEAIGLGFAEPPDLTSNLAIPNPLGPLALGTNTVAGSIDSDCASGPLCGPDRADAFSFEVPEGLVVTNLRLEITGFSSSDGALARVRNFSGGTQVHFIEGDTVFENLLDAPVLPAGTYDLQIRGIHDSDPETFQDLGAVSLDWVFRFDVAPAPLAYAEPPDLTSNLAIPDPLGMLGPGENTVAGSIDADCASGPLCGPDSADAFSFEVPEGLVVTNLRLEITGFTSSDGARARVRNFSGGTEVHSIEGDTVFENLLDAPVLPAGTYDLQIHSVHDFDPETVDDVGAVSLDWRFTFTVPEPGASSLSLAAGVALAGLAGSRRRA